MTTTYLATFRTNADHAERLIKADSPKQALQRARGLANDPLWMPDYQSYDSTSGIEHIEIRSADGNLVAEWLDGELRLRLAAGELLEALETQSQAAQSVIDAWCDGDLAGAVRMLNASLADANTAIAKAKGGAA